MTISLKNVKVNLTASRETYFFSAVVYIDNVKFCHIDNDGQGGSDRLTPIDNQTMPQLRDAISQMNIDFDMEVATCLDAHMHKKEVKKLLKRISYIKPGSNDVYMLPAKYKPNEQNFKNVQLAAWWKDTFTFVKDLSSDHQKLLNI